MKGYVYSGTKKNEATIFKKRTLYNGKWYAPCGTPAAYARHLRWNEEPCAACKDAHADARMTQRGGPKPVMPKPCGTPAAYARHLYRGEYPCEECRKGQAAYEAERNGHQTTGRRNKPAVCGTPAGYRKHLRNGEATCFKCRLAENQNRAKYPSSRKKANV